MHRWYVIASLLALASLSLPVSAAEEKSKTSGSQNNTEPPKQKLIPVGQILGEVMKVDENGKSFTLRMHQQVPQVRFNNMYRAGGGCSS